MESKKYIYTKLLIHKTETDSQTSNLLSKGKGQGEEWIGGLGLAYAYYRTWNIQGRPAV